MRTRVAILVSALTVVSVLLIWYFRSTRHAEESGGHTTAPVDISTSASTPGNENFRASDLAPTNVSAHNLMLRKGPGFRVYVRWLRGQMARAHRNINPSF